jgi:hypothetical protein
MIFASTKVRLGAYVPLFPVAATVALVLAVLTWIVGMPSRKTDLDAVHLEAQKS